MQSLQFYPRLDFPGFEFNNLLFTKNLVKCHHHFEFSKERRISHGIPYGFDFGFGLFKGLKAHLLMQRFASRFSKLN